MLPPPLSQEMVLGTRCNAWVLSSRHRVCSKEGGEAVPRIHHPWPGGPEAYGPGARRPANPPVSGKSLYLLGVIQNLIPNHKSM